MSIELIEFLGFFVAVVVVFLLLILNRVEEIISFLSLVFYTSFIVYQINAGVDPFTIAFVSFCYFSVGIGITIGYWSTINKDFLHTYNQIKNEFLSKLHLLLKI